MTIRCFITLISLLTLVWLLADNAQTLAHEQARRDALDAHLGERADAIDTWLSEQDTRRNRFTRLTNPTTPSKGNDNAPV